MRKPFALLLATITLLGLPHGARASLGGNVDTITTDQSRMVVRLHAVARAGAGNLHTLTLANGGEVREYTNAAGVVYAIRWTGPGKPDLESLLGSLSILRRCSRTIRRPRVAACAGRRGSIAPT